MTSRSKRSPLTEPEYARLLRFRTELRRFEAWSRSEATRHGLTSAQHQLLLAVRGHDGEQLPTIGDLAEYLLVRHHSAVELVDRAAELGFVSRVHDTHDHRVVRVQLTARGRSAVRALSEVHLAELQRLAPLFERLAAD
ncbi:MarR family winged helix-turn-helix transcriptional regulator [Angustibacter sp. Root456]|uniref:MarR family winged helix-turn-helix transcriptional regulator n=1 Tax=Angustibacter sp. Root456 TaxID=1736539 RepID=UPI0006F74D7B|nr:MarR family transcriptional regulator [Angustibacter sp. Root456]KQX63677.1 MarR family transcriptional regulator [Angustibacter sp. Root456]